MKFAMGGVAGACLLLSMAAMWPSLVTRANGATVEVVQTVSGPYEIMVGILPSPPVQGFTHLTVTVADTNTGQPVTDAQVLAFFQHEEEGRQRQAQLFNSDASPEYYDRSLDLSRAGLWFVTVEVSNALGQTSVDFRLEVEGQPQSLAGRLVWGVMTGVVLLGAAYVVWSIRRTGRRRRSQL